jgi:cyclic beta-1,2-glucan synthetase
MPCPAWIFPKAFRRTARTLVVVPTMLTSAAGVEDLIEALEVRFLANRDEHLHFGLLTDFRDAAIWKRSRRRIAAALAGQGSKS